MDHQYSVQLPNEHYMANVTISTGNNIVEMKEALRRDGRPAGGNVAVWEFAAPDQAEAFAAEVTEKRFLINRAVYLADERGGRLLQQ